MIYYNLNFPKIIFFQNIIFILYTFKFKVEFPHRKQLLKVIRIMFILINKKALTLLILETLIKFTLSSYTFLSESLNNS